MKRHITITLGFALLAVTAYARSHDDTTATTIEQPAAGAVTQLPVRFHDEAADKAKIEQLLREAPAGLTRGQYASWMADHLLGLPYVAGTLERQPEELTIDMEEMDCTTFLETVSALAMTAAEGQRPWTAFARNLQSLRYRGGREPQGRYTARLHYISDWVMDNINRGTLTDVTGDLPGAVPVTKSLDFMSTHRESYPALADSASFAEIKSIEAAYRNHRWNQLKYASMNSKNLSMLKDGDIVLLNTKTPGLDSSHVGFIKFVNGVPHLVHASSAKGETIVDPLPLTEYLKKNPKITGIRVLRLKDY